MNTISYETYSILCNRVIGWCNSNNHLANLKLRCIYGTLDNRTADRQTIITKCTENYNNNLYFNDDLCTEFLQCLILDNKEITYLPTYVTSKEGERYTNIELVDMCHRVVAYETLHHQKPTNIRVNPHAGAETTFTHFTNHFGEVKSIDEALQKILGHGYSYYYNSTYSNNVAIDRIYNHQGVNCTDSAQVFYRIGQALGYTPEFLQVQCQSGGHIRLRLKHPQFTEDEWIYRDPACVLSGKQGIRGNWCMKGKLIACNPSWIFTDLEQ